MISDDFNTKLLTGFIKSQENLSNTRFIQDTTTNWLPKAVCTRSKADFAEMSFLEFLESAIFYFMAPCVGEKLYRNNLFKKVQPEAIKEKVTELIPKSVDIIKNDKTLTDAVKNQSIATKAGITLACAAVPVAEYNLSFAKNLFTLKTFDKANFNDIANLEGDENETKAQKELVENHAKTQLKKAVGYSTAALLGGLALAKYGAKSKNAMKFSEALLEPGKKISSLFGFDKKAKTHAVDKGGKFAKNADEFLNEYLNLDFDCSKGKMDLSKGQLALTAIAGLFGYSSAAKDRGELDYKEVWTRVPLVVFYTIFGGSMFDWAFKNILAKKGKFPDLIKKGVDGSVQKIPSSDKLEELAADIAKKKGTNIKDEFKRLTKEKAIITGVPYAFSLLFMGFSLSLITRLWTQYRYNHQEKNPNNKSEFQKFHNEFVKHIDKNAFKKFTNGENKVSNERLNLSA